MAAIPIILHSTLVTMKDKVFTFVIGRCAWQVFHTSFPHRNWRLVHSHQQHLILFQKVTRGNRCKCFFHNTLNMQPFPGYKQKYELVAGNIRYATSVHFCFQKFVVEGSYYYTVGNSEGTTDDLSSVHLLGNCSSALHSKVTRSVSLLGACNCLLTNAV